MAVRGSSGRGAKHCRGPRADAAMLREGRRRCREPARGNARVARLPHDRVTAPWRAPDSALAPLARPPNRHQALHRRPSMQPVVPSKFFNWFLVQNRLMLTLLRFEGGRPTADGTGARDAPAR